MSREGSDDVRCPGCRRLLAKQLENGELEVKSGDRVHVRLRIGEVICPGCSVSVRLAAPPSRDVFTVTLR